MAGLATLISLTTVPTGSGCPRVCACVCKCVFLCVSQQSHSSHWHLSEPGWPPPIQRFLISESIMWPTLVKGCRILFLIGWPHRSAVMWPVAHSGNHQLVSQRSLRCQTQHNERSLSVIQAHLDIGIKSTRICVSYKIVFSSHFRCLYHNIRHSQKCCIFGSARQPTWQPGKDDKKVCQCNYIKSQH